MYHIFFIHSSVDGHLGCFHDLTVVNSAAMNIGVHVSFKLEFSWNMCPEAGLLGTVFNFLRNLHTVFHGGCPFYVPTNRVEEFPFLHTLCSIYCL